MKVLMTAIMAALLCASVTMTYAAPSCSNWMRQSDGSSWRICVGDDGRQYCEQSKNGRISRISCR